MKNDKISEKIIHIVANLKTEYASRPVGIEISNPRFSWQNYYQANIDKEYENG